MQISEILQLQTFIKKVKSIWHTDKIPRSLKPWHPTRHVISFHKHNSDRAGISISQRYHMLREREVLKIAEMWTNDPRSVSHISTGPQQSVMTEHQSWPASNWWGLSEKGSVYSPLYGGAKSKWRTQRTVSHLL